MYFKMMGTALQLKDDVVPHLNLDSHNSSASSSLTDSARKRKHDNIAEFKGYIEPASTKRRLFEGDVGTLEDDVVNVMQTPTKSNTVFVCSVESPSGTFIVTEDNKPVIKMFDKCIQVERQHFTLNKQVATDALTVSGPAFASPADPAIDLGTRQKVVLKPIQQSKRDPVAQQAQSTSSSSSNSGSFSDTSLYSRGSEATSSTSAHVDIDLESAASTFQQALRRNSTLLLIQHHSKFYLGIPQVIYNVVKMITKWTKVDYLHVLITLKKVRLNDANFRLAMDFGMSESNVSKIVRSSVVKVANVLQSFIFWPSEKQIKNNLPVPFRLHYSKVQSIIDCLEVEIQRPQNPLQQSATWSEYKKCNTLKYLISGTPSGSINYISPAFGGRITDNNIVAKSGFLDALPDHAHVLADRGFKQIDEYLIGKNCRLTKPPSVSASKKPSKSEVHCSKTISALRIILNA